MHSFCHEVKDTLARLLATENLIVEHKQVDTASFDVERRVLTLPMWKKASSTVYDLLVGHEVGHALYTPNFDWKQDDYQDVPPSFVNIVEDARIERMIKRRFPGFSKTFYKGYQELSESDFFCIADDDLDTMNFIDRINIHFKVGAFSMVPFSDEELYYVDKVENSETFDEVLEISKEIYLYLKSNTPKQKVNIDIDMTAQANACGGQNIQVEWQETSESDSERLPGDPEGVSEQSKTGSHGNDSKPSSPDEDGDEEDKFNSVTDKAFEDNQKKLIDTTVRDTIYLDFPKAKLDKIVIDVKTISDSISKYYSSEFSSHKQDLNNLADEQYRNYRKESNRGVNYLVKEFECKKSADAYSRAAVSRTGVLDTTKLHTYKYNEDLFKKVTILPDGKNHGLIFVLDWSGSMQDVILDTVKQLLNLVWFCKKVNIPFEVYAFTYDYVDTEIGYHEDDSSDIQVMEDNTLYLYRSFRLLNILSHKRTSSEFEKDCHNLWKVSFFHQKRVWDMIPHGLGLSGTPLNESLIALRYIIPNFISENALSKVNTVILTDGESASIARVTEYKKTNYAGWGRVSLNPWCQIRDKKLGRIYKAAWNDNDWNGSVTKILLENLRHNFPQVNIIGIRILPSRDVRNFFYTYLSDYTEKMKKVWSKEKSYAIMNNGYDALYVMASTSLNESDQFDVEDNASISQIRNAFKKSLKAKSMNKKVLSSFISMVA